MIFYTSLAENHGKMLFEESGIAPEIAAERGYATVTSRAELPDFKKYQRRAPALRVPIRSPDGETSSSQIRPDNPRKDKQGKPLKYETPGGSKAILDTHPRMRERVRSSLQDLWVTEGIKKADSLASRDLPTVGFIGVWNWQRDGEMLACWDHVRLDGRRVYVVFDSDVMEKENVQLALERLVAALEARGADVRVVYLPGGDEKVGVDDYLVAGGTVAELKALARVFKPQDLGCIRLSRDEKLRALVEDLVRRFWDFEWTGIGGHTDRDVYLKLVEAARRHGKPVEDGMRVEISHGTLQLEAALGSSRTLCKSIYRLEEAGLIYRDNEGRKPDKAGAFVLCATVKYYGEEGGTEEKATQGLQSLYPGSLHPRAPRLRWSRPKFTPRRGTVRGTRKVRQGPKPEPRDRIERLGKSRGAILDALDDAGGTATIQELTETLHKKRPRDMRRRLLPMLEEVEIITVNGDAVALTENWLERLEAERVRGGEREAEEVARRRLAVKREAYHRRHQVKPDRAPTDAELAAQRASFEAALETKKRAREDRMRDAALEAFRAHGSGAAMNLKLAADGELANPEYLVKSVLAWHRVLSVQWERIWERWRGPVLEAAAIVAREHAPPPPSEPVPDEWKGHSLNCECSACLYPVPQYAQLGGAA